MLPLLLLAPCALAYSATDMLSAPRPHAPILNSAGNAALHVVDQWNATTDVTARTVWLIQLPSGKTHDLLHTVPSHASEVFWLGDKGEWGWLNGTDVYAVDHRNKSQKLLSFPEGVEANSVRYTQAKLVFVGQLWEGHEFEDTPRLDKEYAERGDSGVVFDELFIRCVARMSGVRADETLGHVEDARESVDSRRGRSVGRNVPRLD